MNSSKKGLENEQRTNKQKLNEICKHRKNKYFSTFKRYDKHILQKIFHLPVLVVKNRFEK